MYDRYKTKNSKSGIFKFIITIIICAAILFTGYKFKRYLVFWKYSNRKLEKKVEDARKIKDVESKKDALLSLEKLFEQYKNDNVTSVEAFLMSGELHYLTALTYLPVSFSELIINEKHQDISLQAKKEFLRVIKDMRKAQALMDGDELSLKYSMMLARSCFFSNYNSPQEIYLVLMNSTASDNITGIENVRFFGIINILNNNSEYGLKLIREKGAVTESNQGRLFFATAQKMAKRFTNAIETYKDVLKRTSDPDILKLVYINLGKIYFNQSLYKESLDHFNLALKIDEKDTISRIWIGKNYSAMGEKDKARAVWSEVLTNDRTNNEVKKLLGVM